MSEEQMLHEQDFWNTFVQSHVPSVYPGMREILRRHKAEGGKLCVVSHSYRDNILRDYRENGLPEPDLVFGWECPREKRKPNPWPLEQIMDTFGFSPSQLLVVDDLKPGYDMAKTAGVPFAAAGWANDIEVIRRFMQANCDWYFASVQSLHDFLYPLDDKEA